jgi:hypothetical protein|tara:strand:- start:231 stop:353 length:123 start_codon:yes stop_codon:yes gene_type:complete
VVEELTQNNAGYAGKLAVTDNGLRDFNGHCLDTSMFLSLP